ncbi:MAG: heme ABC exporter ATP-binding protein CcmA [Pikeienuella sp.]
MTLAIEQLIGARNGRPIFGPIDFTLAPGMAAALRGPNGAGKSTLLRVLAGFLRPAGGDVQLDGARLSQDRSLFAEKIAYAGHLDAVKSALDVGDNLALWARLHGAQPDRVAAALAQFGLSALAARPAAECSAGQRRRLGLARLALIDRPLWLLDEPTVSLDAVSVGWVADMVRAHCAAGGMALIATHADLGLGEIPVLALPGAPDRRATGAKVSQAAADPFLDGDWR